MSPRVLPEGTIITCPKCGDQIATLRRKIVQGDIIKSDDFEFTPEQICRKGDETRCKKCNALYGRLGQFHTSKGWL